MKILFITQYYPPEIGAASNRIGYFAQFLARNGHDVAVLTSTPNYPEGKVYPGYKNRGSAKKENDVMVYRTRIFLSHKKTTLGRLMHYLSFVISSLATRQKMKKPDLIIATSPPLFSALIGVIFKKLWKVPLVADIRDLWPESVESVGAVRSRRLLRQAQRLAAWIYKNAIHITVTSPGIQKKLPRDVQNKISIMPNGAELDLFRPDIDGMHIVKKWGLHGKFVALYTGNLGLAQAPEVLVAAAKILQSHHDIVLLVVGSGVLLPKLEKAAQEKNLTNIIFTGIQPRAQMPQYIAAADIGIIPYKVSETFRNTLPSKMFDYMAGGKPIIINLEGEAAELIQKAQCGLVAEEESGQALADAILHLKNNPHEAEQKGRNGRKFTVKNYTREAVAKKLLELVETQFS